jgi:hypothetical protein
MDKQPYGRNQHRKNDQQRKTQVTGSAVAKKNKLSRRKKAKAKDTLNKAVFSVVKEIKDDTFLRSHLFSHKVAKDKLVVGAYIIVKTNNDCFDIFKKNLDSLVYKDVFLFDTAMALVESLNIKNDTRTAIILETEQEYTHYYTEMQFFKQAYNNAVKEGQGNQWAFEDRYMIVKYKAEIARDKLAGFRTSGKSSIFDKYYKEEL